jgi:membrane-associated phospholipid phosphatase
MHVANAVLFALYAGRRWPSASAFFWLFAIVIMVGSVVLGWHYAVDGYAGGLISIAVWKMVGWWLARHAPAGVETAA